MSDGEEEREEGNAEEQEAGEEYDAEMEELVKKLAYLQQLEDLVERKLHVGPNTPPFVAPRLIHEDDEYEISLINILKEIKGDIDRKNIDAYVQAMAFEMLGVSSEKESGEKLKEIYSSHDMKQTPKCGAVIPANAPFFYRCYDCQKSADASLCPGCFWRSKHKDHR